MSVAILIRGRQSGRGGCHGNSGDSGLQVTKEALFTGIQNLQ